MSAKHTPGPWWVTDSGVRDRGGYICHTNPPQHYQGQDERFAQESAERAANKLLIAAVPDMFEALEAIEFALGQGMPAAMVLDENSPIRDCLRAAIAKATGEQP
jgi:hypothetical protein